jgi:spermidine synthase
MVRHRALSALVFVAGIGTLAVEISASRLLAPYYGSSTIVWANLIGLVLASLSLGYWLGGKLADRRPEPRVLGTVVLAAAVWIAAIPFLARPFLDVTVEGIDEASAGAAIGSFFATLGLFAPAVTLLGMVAPFAIRLAIGAVEAAGSVAGRLYALSTVGSLVGTFVSALIAIPLIGTQRTLLLSAALLALVGAVLVGRRWLVVPLAVAALAVVPPGAIKADDDLVYETESRYQYIQVVQRDEARYLRLNEGVAVHSVWRPDSVLTGGEWDMFLVPPVLLGRPVRDVAILGNAAGTIARAYGVYYPRARIDGVELDPEVSSVGRRWFGLGDNPRLRVRDADARPFLAGTDRRYDLIIVDAYRQPYIPFYLATREFFDLAKRRLRPGGIVALNVASVPDDHELARSISGTLASELPQVWSWKPLRFNQLVLGLTRPVSRAELARRTSALAPRLRPLGDLFARDVRPAERIDRPWTDDRAPVEWLTDRMILEFAAAGGELDEEPLPTDPDDS